MHNKRIIVVDDSDFDRGLLVKALSKKTEATILDANSGERCLEVIAGNAPDLILLDIMMPGLSGLETLSKIRERFTRIQVPVLMVTSKVDASDVVECLKAGANDYITKPVCFDVAVSRIQLHLDLVNVAKEVSAIREAAAAEAVVSTFHFEINSLLSAAIATLESPDLNNPDVKEGLKSALWKIADVLKSINAVQGPSLSKCKEVADGIKLLQLGDASF
ncbi:MAG: response regulator [Verrucomicrobiota bacterium]